MILSLLPEGAEVLMAVVPFPEPTVLDRAEFSWPVEAVEPVRAER